MARKKAKTMHSPQVATARQLSERERLGVGTSTAERLRHSGGRLVTKTIYDTEGVHEQQRVEDWPVARLKLGAGDTHQRRYEAAERLYAHYYYANMNPLAARDYRQPYAGHTGSFPIMPATESQAHHRAEFRRAREALGSDRAALATFLIVCEEQSVLTVGYHLCPDRRHEKQVTAVAVEMLKDGLDRLIALWGLSGKGEGRVRRLVSRRNPER